MILIKWKSDPVFLPLWLPLFLTRKSSQLLKAKLLFAVSPSNHSGLRSAAAKCHHLSSLHDFMQVVLFTWYVSSSFLQVKNSCSLLGSQWLQGKSSIPGRASCIFLLQFFTTVVPNVFLVPGTSFMEDYFLSTLRGMVWWQKEGWWLRWSQDDSSTLHLLFIHFYYYYTSAPPQIIRQ